MKGQGAEWAGAARGQQVSDTQAGPGMTGPDFLFSASQEPWMGQAGQDQWATDQDQWAPPRKGKEEGAAKKGQKKGKGIDILICLQCFMIWQYVGISFGLTLSKQGKDILE